MKMDLYKEKKAFKCMAAVMFVIEKIACVYFWTIMTTVFLVGYLFLNGDLSFTNADVQIQTMVRVLIEPFLFLVYIMVGSLKEFPKLREEQVPLLAVLILIVFPQLVYQGNPDSILPRTLVSGAIFLFAKAFKEGSENQIHFLEIRLAGGAVEGEKNSGQDRTT